MPISTRRLAFLLLLSLTSCAAPARRIVILHHNDFHSWNTPWDAVTSKGDSITIQGAGGLNGLARAVMDTSAPAIWLFAGDEFTGTAVSSLTEGASQIQVAGRLGSQIVVLGNHEFDHGLARAEAYRDSIGKVVLGGANLRYRDGRPFTTEFYDAELGGVPFRIIGLVPPNLHLLASGSAGLEVLEPETAIRKFLPSKNRATIILSHMGVERDSMLAANVPEIDLIVGGHTHATLRKPILIGGGRSMNDSLPEFTSGRIPGTLIVQAGAKGIYLGYLSMVIENGDVTDAAGWLLLNDGATAAPDADLAAVAQEIDDRMTGGMKEVIAALTEPLTRQGFESTLGRWEADIFRLATGADVAFQNPGGLRRELAAGSLTIRDVFEVNPFGNTLVVFPMTGAELRKVLEKLAADPREYLQASGISATIDLSLKGVADITVGGTPIEAGKSYSVATNSYVWSQFESYFGFERGDRKMTDGGKLDRDIIAEAARKQATISAPQDVRLQYVEEGSGAGY